nr:type II toxin-antitoxin system RelE/ParE family toxin [Pilibacter termitis]
MMNATEKLGLEVAKRQEWIKKIEDNLFELRSKHGSDIQRGLYFKYENGRFIVTHGFSKKTDKTPKREIERAKNLRKNFYRIEGGKK